MRMKNAALFALGLLSANFWPHDSARCQTSLAPPLSLARPAPPPDDSAPPPAIIRASPSIETDDDASGDDRQTQSAAGHGERKTVAGRQQQGRTADGS